MLNVARLNDFWRQRGANSQQVATHLSRGRYDLSESIAALGNWRRGLFKPEPSNEDIRLLAAALAVEENDLVAWRSSYRFAPISCRKARLVTELIAGRPVQDALDVLKFTPRRAAPMVSKVLKAAVADADEQRAEVDRLYVSEARVDDAGIRLGTRRWMPKDRGRAHPLRKKACHIHVAVSQL